MLLDEVVAIDLTADELALIARALEEYRSHSTTSGLVVDHIDALVEKLSEVVEE